VHLLRQEVEGAFAFGLLTVPLRLQAKVLPGYSAGIISGHAGFADVRTLFIDRARRRHSHLPNKAVATVAVAPHASPRIIHKRWGNAGDISFIFQREPRPF